MVQVDRRRESVRDEAGVVARFGVSPQSIPDYLAVVGDSADGFPGVTGWGEKGAASTLSRYPSSGRHTLKTGSTGAPSIKKARKLSENTV